MIALTQEKREELKAFLSASIENRCTVYTLAKQRELEALRDQVALASLTAEPEHYVFKHPFAKSFYSLVDESCKGYDEVFPAYTAPPVPEIKFPSDKEKPQGKLSFDFHAGWYAHGVSTKRLNGLGE